MSWTQTERVLGGAQWSAEANALITTFFFAWLVGPLERKPVEVQTQLL